MNGTGKREKPSVEVWQTTNQEPWVSALVDGAIKFKTRRQHPNVPVGAPLLLHASTKIWPDWQGFTNDVMEGYADRVPEMRKTTCGRILGVCVVSRVCRTDCYMRKDLVPWDVFWGNCAAYWAWACDPIIKLKVPVKARGYQAPFCRAKPEVVQAVCDANVEAKKLLKEMGAI